MSNLPEEMVAYPGGGAPGDHNGVKAARRDLGKQLLTMYGGANFLRMSSQIGAEEATPEGLPALRQRLAQELGDAILQDMSPQLKPGEDGTVIATVEFWMFKEDDALELVANCYSAGGGQP